MQNKIRTTVLLIVLLTGIVWMTFPLPATGQISTGTFSAADSFWENPGWIQGPGFMMWQPWGIIHILSKLPVPGNKEWINRLKAARVSEIKAMAQFEADQAKFNAFMPYAIVIPQTDEHIRWIKDLFKAYGLAMDEELYLVGPAASLTEAYEKSKAIENELILQFEWLVKNAEDRDSARALDTILIRSRFHSVMFEHFIRMGNSKNTIYPFRHYRR